MKLCLYPYQLYSKSCKNLVTNLGNIKRIKRDSLTFNPRNKIIINWGNSQPPVWANRGGLWLNHPEVVKVAADKLRAFQALTQGGVSIPEWTTSIDTAHEWQREGTTIIARKILNGHSGAGIVVVEQGEEIPAAPLYVKYKKKRKEFRVHVFLGVVIYIQEKRKEGGENNVNTKIRNKANGWVYCRENIVEPPSLRAQAVSAVKALGLSFGAVDIIWNAREDVCYVLEVNTAPGLEGTTLERYAEAFRLLITIKDNKNAMPKLQ